MSKIQAFEDCITFVPHLFRLSKSIIVAEPLTTFHNQLRGRMGATARKEEDNNHNDMFRHVNTHSDAKHRTSHYKDHITLSINKKMKLLNQTKKLDSSGHSKSVKFTLDDVANPKVEKSSVFDETIVQVDSQNKRNKLITKD